MDSSSSARRVHARARDAHSQSTSGSSSDLELTSYLLDEATSFSDEGEYDRALRALRQLLALAPDHGPARLLVARIQIAAQQWPQALAAMAAAEECGELVPAGLRSLALAHSQPMSLGPDHDGSALPVHHFAIRDRVLQCEGLEGVPKDSLTQVWVRFPEIDAILLHGDPDDGDLIEDGLTEETERWLPVTRAAASAMRHATYTDAPPPAELRDVLVMLSAVLDKLADVVDR